MSKKPHAVGRDTGNIFSRPSATALSIQVSDAEREIAIRHYMQGNLIEAEAFCRRLTQRHPWDGFGWKVLGATLQRQARTAESLTPMQTAAKLLPGDWEVFNNLGVTHDALGDATQAETCFTKALALKPDFLDALRNAAENLRRQNKLDQALAAYQRICALDPSNGYAQHMADTLGSRDSDRAPDLYVIKVFDDYADRFESHLTGALHYQVPQQLVTLLTQAAAAPAGGWDVLDLGCGTGLVGRAISPWCRSLTGVDLSGKMIDKSRDTGLYQRLVRDDLVRMLRQEATASMDVLLAADVFIYIGRLDDLMIEAHRVLRPGGRLAFSIENLDADDGRPYKLERTGRYSQSLAYMASLARSHGFVIEACEASVIRHEAEHPVPGHLCVWRR